MKRIPTLDGWRAIAILLVVSDHVVKTTTGYSLFSVSLHGVTVFFVLSGFLITTKLIEERPTLTQFYIKRFFRLMPAAWTYLAFVIGVSVATGHVKGLGFQIAGCVFFFQNFAIAHQWFWLTGHFWSLSIEEQFYLVWPAMLLMLGIPRLRVFAGVAACAIALHRLLEFHQLETAPWQLTAGTLLRADALLAGCLAALVLPHLRKYMQTWMTWPLLAAVISFAILVPGNIASFAESITIALLLCVSSNCPRGQVGRFLESKLLCYIGALSYSLYLWQEPFCAFPGFAHPATIPVRILLTFAFAQLSYSFIESPSRRWGARFSRPRTSPIAAVI